MRQDVAKARFLLRRSIHEVRCIAENLRPSELDELGLVAAVRDLCEDFKERTQLMLTLVLPASALRFSNEIELALYRIVQEALTNIEKHSQATEVVLALNLADGVISLNVRDNGKGLGEASANGRGKRYGLGLIDMRERCAFLGGAFSVASKPSLGTELTVRIPAKKEYLMNVA